MPSVPTSVIVKHVDLSDGDLASVFAGADVVVHLASAVRAGTAEAAAAQLDLALFRRVLDALSPAGVAHLVMMSSATVYGARVGNPIPLTEGAAVRPNSDFAWAVQRYRLELLARQWSAELPAPARSVTVLRPTAVVADDRLGSLARTLSAARAGVAADGDPPRQFLHTDDLASAVVTAALARHDGALNVAPDGWIPPDALAGLEGPRPRLRVPQKVARRISALRWRSGLAPTPPGAVPYTAHSWVVANDRLRALGWTPQHSNEEAWVASHQPGPLESLSARRRQEILLAAAGTTTLGAAATVAWIVVRLRRRQRRAAARIAGSGTLRALRHLR